MSALTDEANAIAAALLAGTDFGIELPDFSSDDFKIPEIDLTNPIFGPINRTINTDLTVGENSLIGDGTFDLLMRGFRAHLKAEYDAGRISGAEYTKAYIACTESAMSTGAQFLVTRDTTYWSSVNAQLQAQAAQIGIVVARVQLEAEKTKLQVLRIQALNQSIEYALNKLRLATESVNYATATYSLEELLPTNKQLVLKQIEQIQNEIDLFATKQLMMEEQVEVQRAQTLDTRRDGAPIVGVLGKQKDLYAQQITSYKRDGEIKVVKIFTDAWTVQKTIDEGLAPPDGFTNTNLDTLLANIRTNNGI